MSTKMNFDLHLEVPASFKAVLENLTELHYICHLDFVPDE